MVNRYLMVGVLLMLFVSGGAEPVRSWAAPAEAGAGLSLDFRDVELADLVRTMSEMTGRNFIYDETLKGKVTIISPRPMSQDEAYRVFLSVLNVKGFTVVPAGAVQKIVPTRDAKENTLPTQIGRSGGGDQYVTRLLPLKHVDAASLVTTVLTPLVPKTSHVVAYPPSNTLIITDTAANIDRLARIIAELDVASSSLDFTVIPLQHSSATEVAELANQFLSQGGGAAIRRSKVPGAAQAGDTQQGRVLAFPRSNALVVMASADDLATVRRLVAELDRPPDQGQASLHVYYLEHASAEGLAKTLNEIATGTRQQRKKPGQEGTQAVSLEAVTVTADLPTNSLVVNATPEEFAALAGIVRRLDIPRKQVFVEALILELSMDITSALGISLQAAGAVGNDGMIFGTSNLNTGPAGLGNLVPPSGSSVPSLLGRSINGILAGGLFNPITVTGLDGNPVTVPAFSVLIDASKTNSDVNILSAPRLLASDNEEAEIVVGSNVPIITQRLTDTTNVSAQSVAIERQDVALILRFTPQVTEGSRVRLKVYQEITDVAQTSVGDVNQVGPTLTKRLLRNTVVAEDGQTVVLGGLIANGTRETVSKTPLLGDIPILGWLFKRRTVEERKTNLLVFITPHIVEDATDLAAVTRRSEGFMQTFRQEMEFPIEDTPLQQELRGLTPEAAAAPAVE